MPHGREKLCLRQILFHYFHKQQIESRQLDNEGSDIDAVVEQIPFLFIELGEILPVLVVLEQEYMIGIIQGQHDDCEKQEILP